MLAISATTVFTGWIVVVLVTGLVIELCQIYLQHE